MAESPLRLIRYAVEFRPKEEAKLVPRNRRGIYVLYEKRGIGKKRKYEVRYVGMTAAGNRGGLYFRLMSHRRSKRKAERWTHFSAYEMWENIRNEEIIELEGILRHIYRLDSTANVLNVQRRFKKLIKLRFKNTKQWRAT